jgi:hypothetical protein
VVDFEGFREYEPIIGHLHDVMTITNGMLLSMESHDALCRKVLAHTLTAALMAIVSAPTV